MPNGIILSKHKKVKKFDYFMAKDLIDKFVLMNINVKIRA